MNPAAELTNALLSFKLQTVMGAGYDPARMTLPDIALGYVPALRRLKGLTRIGLRCQAMSFTPAIECVYQFRHPIILATFPMSGPNC